MAGLANPLKIACSSAFFKITTLKNIRTFSSSFEVRKTSLISTPNKVYPNPDLDKERIIGENRKKAGIYMWVNKINNKRYIGSSVNLALRLLMYFNYSYLIRANSMVICKALLKEGYSGFRLEILEYLPVNPEFNKNLLLEREQYYFDALKPEYNILKVAGSSLGRKLSKETKALLSLSATGRIFSPDMKENGK